jgi:hypothetical protein
MTSFFVKIGKTVLSDFASLTKIIRLKLKKLGKGCKKPSIIYDKFGE